MQSATQTVDAIIGDAIAHRASDVHFETVASGVRVRWRIDGLLYEKAFIEPSLGLQVISRIKVLAHINIAERRIPHDGKFSMVIGSHSVDLRVSTFPSLYGEKVVVRILDRAAHMIELDQIGLSCTMIDSFRQLLSTSSGFFLVAGPTGSGKTTTLYAALSLLNSPEKNIITLEDPVEYNLAGITQGQINPDAGFTFQRGLRALLRQDPDIVMVGEMRDAETAQIAIEASLTGHVVLSTIHTNDAPSVITRLIDMGIEPFLVNAALAGVLAQRLARTICSACKERVEPKPQEQDMLEHLGMPQCKLYRGAGCDSCMQLGYQGRTGIFELLVMTPAMRELVMKRPSFDLLVEQATKDGLRPLLSDGLAKVDEGCISLNELIRVAL
jgi:type IV pilus assembly protein PilB